MTIETASEVQVEFQDAEHDRMFLEGASDAAFGESPRSLESAYLDGYMSRLRALVEEKAVNLAKLQIRWVYPQSFAFGYLDGPGDWIDGESNGCI